MFPLLVMSLYLSTTITPAYSGNTWEYLTTTLPKAVSDMSSTYAESSEKIYLFGGCESGNTRADFNPNMFICTSVSKEGFIFNPEESSFDSTAVMPRERYRHSAAVLNGNVYLIGGRDSEDNIILDVDVYNIEGNIWRTPFQLESVMAKSDFGMFAYDNSLYMMGGYDSNYTTSDATYKLDTITLAVQELSKMIESRGDIYAKRIDNMALVTGGFTHEDDFCQAKNSTEMYDISNDVWVEMNDMNINRGDQALVALDQYVFALGGEYKIKCSGDPAESTTPSDEVDVLDLSTPNTPWRKLDDIPDNRFRFTGEAYPPTDTIYIFGGQKYYDLDCDCYDVSDKVLAYHVHHDTFLENLMGEVTTAESAAFQVMFGFTFHVAALTLLSALSFM